MLTVPTRARPKKELVQQIYDQHKEDGDPISLSKAGRIADKLLRGTYVRRLDPGHSRVISYADPVGEEAVRNVLRQQKKTSGPGASSAKTRTETAPTNR